LKRSVLYIGNKLEKQGRTVSTIDSLSGLLEAEGYHVITASSVKNKFFRMLDMLHTTFKHRKTTDLVLIDTYSTQNFYYAVAVAKLCRTLKIPYYTLLHGGNLPKRLDNSPKVSRKLFNGAKQNVSPSQYLLEAFRSKGYENCVYIPNSIELENYPYLLRKDLRPKLLWVRSFAEIYNPMLAINALKKLLNNGVMATLTMIGPDKDGSLEKCKTEAEAQKLPVTFTGKLSKSEWISLAEDHDVFINTTNFDNMPVSVIEAMALGLPVVSTKVGGIPFLIENNKTGVLVSPNNVDAFAAALSHLLSSATLGETLSVNGRSLAETYDWEKVKSKWHVLLNE
tara:strand:+ start:111601 stop:112617 length:1017 start_codon:yes stop_codon:yes gene_type:complete